MRIFNWEWSTKNGLPHIGIIIGITIITVLLVLTAPIVEMNPQHIYNSGDNLLDFLSHWFTQPEWEYLPKLAGKLWETIEIAIVATALALVLSFPLGILAAINTTPHPLVYHITRNILSFIRALPELVWALVFVSAVGLGPLPGVMALTFVTTGFLAKFFAESMEVVNQNVISGVKATGASKLQILMFAILPQALPDLCGVVLYVIDRNVRAATILGLVGAGGIGYELVSSIRLFYYSRLVLILFSIYLVVTFFDRLSNIIRSKVI
ncbi:MAG: phosphonate ABC transporter, permease protein PhnE [Mastigocoleus sp. MO_167.B18]|nr:phosphonate ABC transporter, permease protein PhnE [Mastigocoleus sp. MO_167.B18]